ncbi:purine-nucleoside phosphorylase [Sphingobacteriales bacterium UPWRP_1]|nr:purine-nucleoside phosphorylase [Sphingobacteriales bacterium TSM_CSM]PSJ76465.1 purine-nucleoside phosphorylase [Sphingobacteriales bacterium UPWRP_1]
MENLLEKIQQTTLHIQARAPFAPQVGIILGTGLGNLVGEIDIITEMPYHTIPHFPLSTVESHSGKLIFGYLSGKPVVAMQGRFHYYEGYSMQQVTFPVRVMKQLGITTLFISNAAGGMGNHMNKGDLMILNDHINLHPDNPLRGKNYEELGPRFPDMSNVYDQALIEKGLEIARKHHIRCHAGIYASVTGPNLETKAEYAYLHHIGANAVGMSTVPEVLVAAHGNLPVFAISVITDIGYPPERIEYVTVEDVIAVAKAAEPKMTIIIKELIGQL